MNQFFITESDYIFHLDQKVVEQWTHQTRLTLIELADSNVNQIYNSQYGRIQSSLYAFEDSQAVIEDYKELDNFKAVDSGYLKLYGLLQALFVQQDSLKNLRKVINNSETNFWNSYQGLHFIRQIRNMTIGHPTDKNGEYFLISQISINKYGYQMVGYRKAGDSEQIDVNTYDLLKTQDQEILELMNLITVELEKPSA